MSVRERDPHSGHMTTGHEWNGIKELNTNVPKIVWTALVSAVFISVIMWFIWPSWPIWNTFTPGVLKTDERAQLVQEIQIIASERAKTDNQIISISYEDLKKKSQLLTQIRADGNILYQENCAACHGVDAKGGNGFPNLVDKAWLWGRSESTILETLNFGINDNHPDTRSAEMLAFGRDGLLDRAKILNVIAYLNSIGESSTAKTFDFESVNNGKEVFQENCASCHADNATGDIEFGAPNLVDGEWIYGGNVGTMFETIWYGRKGHMPAWESRLTDAQRKTLALFVMDISAPIQSGQDD